jgi:hypothetical protein
MREIQGQGGSCFEDGFMLGLGWSPGLRLKALSHDCVASFNPHVPHRRRREPWGPLFLIQTVQPHTACPPRRSTSVRAADNPLSLTKNPTPQTKTPKRAQLAGGSHLPDITVITPVFEDGRIVFFVARWDGAVSRPWDRTGLAFPALRRLPPPTHR